MPSSFVNERSVEYLLTPHFAKILSIKYPNVIPIFFWTSREGGRAAGHCLADLNVIIVALYGRRPKIDVPNQDFIEVKFNEALFRRNDYFAQNGIAVFAGVPVVSSLLGFNFGASCKWFSFNEGGSEELVRLPIKGNGEMLCQHISEIAAIEILDKINKTCKIQSWSDAVEVLRNMRHSQPHFYHGLYGDIYKPVYFVIPI